MYYCKKCGAALTPEKRFCSQCGTPVEEIASTAQPTTPQAETPAATTAQPAAPQVETPASVRALSLTFARYTRYGASKSWAAIRSL